MGYAAAELGQVWKTIDGGTTWREVMNVGFPYYWYGVDALDANTVAVSGFDDSNWRGIVRWTHDGGSTWSDDVVITTDGWSNRIRIQRRCRSPHCRPHSQAPIRIPIRHHRHRRRTRRCAVWSAR